MKWNDKPRMHRAQPMPSPRPVVADCTTFGYLRRADLDSEGVYVFEAPDGSLIANNSPTMFLAKPPARPEPWEPL